MPGFINKLTDANTHLARADRVMAGIIREIGPCTLRPERGSPYESLMRAIAHQQLHARAATTILNRFVGLYDGKKFPDPIDVLNTHHTRLRSVGFSRSKAAAIRDIAAKARDGIVPTRAQARRIDDEALIERLTDIYGVGRWTVEMFLIFSLGRLDVMPVDDFGVQCGLRAAYKLRRKPTRADFERITACWRPYRSIGSWYLWRVADRLKTG
jgi:DNA-3-methyladenine glycosylase II